VALSGEFLSSLAQIDAGQWNAVAGTDYPFLRHEFLYALERTGCTDAHSGWQPCHLLLREGTELCALMPLYLKSHSWGEYVFDWAWADAWQRSGLRYYPKLVTAIPFTPAAGPRLATRAGLSRGEAWMAALEAVQRLARRRDISSWHLLFPEQADADRLAAAGLHRRSAVQFHWFNEGYASFDDFLSRFSSRRRKNLLRERRRVGEQGISLQTLTGGEIGEREWEQFYRFYRLTYARRSGHSGYLTRAFFQEAAGGMGEQVVMVLAHLGRRAVAGALCFRSGDTLFGRYWGCEQEFDCLHFETCYYQGIEYCITHSLARFDSGAQGEHKIQRGFRPVKAWSNHWIADPRLSAAVDDFTRREARHIDAYLGEAATRLPFRKGP
jgi:predicted N-acyltransferase